MLFVRFGCVICLGQILMLISVGVAQKSLSSKPCATLSDEWADRKGRIVGGENAIRGTLPFIASLTRRGGHFCGATIINNRWLATAAHCVCSGLNKILRPNQIKAVLGLHKISEFKRPNSVDDIATTQGDGDSTLKASPFEIGLKKIVVHPLYRCQQPENDIALLELTQTTPFSDTVQPICIADASTKHNNSYVGKSAIISGWGYTNENQEIGGRPDVLQSASVEVWSNDKCQKSFREQKKPYVINRSQMCAGKFDGGVDSCWADSGGPMISEDRLLIGIVSTGIGCARPGLPGIYTRVSEYANWIVDAILV